MMQKRRARLNISSRGFKVSRFQSFEKPKTVRGECVPAVLKP
jgi:hypothetical protein